MARYNDNSCHATDWTNAKLMSELRKYSCAGGFSGSLPAGQYVGGFPADHGPAIREATRLYNQTWVVPIIDEIERRFVKPKR